jgi:uncharacterized protein YegL
MTAGATERSWFVPGKPPERHAGIATLSFALSILLHILLVRQFPETEWALRTQPPEADSRTPWILESVEPDADRAPDAEVPSLFRSDPAAPLPADASETDPQAPPLSPLVQQPEVRPPPLFSENAPVRPPDPSAPLADWSPRVDRIQIDRTLVAESSARLPRRTVPDLVRSPVAPDVSAMVPHPRWIPGLSAEESAQTLPSGSPSPEPGIRFPEPGERAEGGYEGLSGNWMDRIAGMLDGAGGGSEPPSRERSINRFLALELQTYHPPEDPTILFFRMVIRRDGPESLPVLPKDVLFILDVSQSMGTPLLEQCKEGLRKALASLNQHDRFNLIAFRETPALCFPDWSAAGPLEQAKAVWFLEPQKSEGRTDLQAALARIRTARKSESRPLLVLFVSDGLPTLGETDDYRILHSFSEGNDGSAAVFAFGSGPRVNRFFLDFLSRRNRGDTRLEEDSNRAPQSLYDFNLEISRPVLFDLATRFLGIEETEVYPKRLTPLFLDRPLVLTGRIPAESPPAAIRIAGRDQAGPRDMVYRLVWTEPDLEAGPELAREWARLKLADLVSRHLRNPSPESPGEIQALCDEFNLPIPYASRLGFAPPEPLPADE